MDLLAFWLTPPLNVDFLTRLSCVIVYLLSRAQMCAVFWDASFGGRPPEFTRLRLAVVSGTSNRDITLKKTFFEILTLVRNCIFCVEFKSEFDKKNNWVFVEKCLVLVEYQMTKIANTQNWRLSNPEMNSSRNSMHTTCLTFLFSSKLGVSGPVCSNCQWWGDQLVHYSTFSFLVRALLNWSLSDLWLIVNETMRSLWHIVRWFSHI